MSGSGQEQTAGKRRAHLEGLFGNSVFESQDAGAGAALADSIGGSSGVRDALLAGAAAMRAGELGGGHGEPPNPSWASSEGGALDVKARNLFTDCGVLQEYEKVARPERLELPTLWFEARCSIQLSYGRVPSLYPGPLAQSAALNHGRWSTPETNQDSSRAQIYATSQLTRYVFTRRAERW